MSKKDNVEKLDAVVDGTETTVEATVGEPETGKEEKEKGTEAKKSEEKEEKEMKGKKGLLKKIGITAGIIAGAVLTFAAGVLVGDRRRTAPELPKPDATPSGTGFDNDPFAGFGGHKAETETPEDGFSTF